MQWAALIAWLVTALGGAGLGYLWARGGGAAQAAGIPDTASSPPRRARRQRARDVEPVSRRGKSRLRLDRSRVPRRGRPHRHVDGSRPAARRAAPTAPTELPAEASFPLPVVLAHGALGATTLLLSLLAALGVGV
jgi:hypothetical protein